MAEFDPFAFVASLLPHTAKPDWPGMLRLAAEGNGCSMMMCARLSLREALTVEDDLAAACAFGEAITFARLFASDGSLEGLRCLFEALSEFARWAGQKGRGEVSAVLEALALNVADRMADAGDEFMADLIVRAGEALSPEIFEEAKRRREGATI